MPSPSRRLGPIHPSLVVLALVSAILTPRVAVAWHDDGHRIVGEIAERRLSAHARAQVLELLADMPDYATLASAATWADQLARQDPSFAFVSASHYANFSGRTMARELHAACLDSAGCVATGVAFYAEIVRSERASKADRAEALRFLAHFVGDAHQPLHAGRAGDRGGNDIDRLRLTGWTPAGETSNLHAIWDGGIVAITLARAGWDWRRYAIELDSRVDAEDIARWGRGGVYDWLDESRLLAAGDAYLHADGITPVGKGDTLGEDYYARNLDVVELRLQQGGVRLALVLEEVFQ
jgi:nuclease S1